MAEAAKVRLVRCPKCENLLPEPPDYSLYECGGCGAVLKAKKKGLMEDGLSEISDDAKGVEIFEKGSTLNVSEVGMENSVGIELNRANEINDIDRVVFNGSSITRMENKEVPFNSRVNRKERDRTRRPEYFDDEYSSSAEGMTNDSEWGKDSDLDMKRLVYSNFHSENELDEIGHPMRSLRSRPSMDQRGLERNQSGASSVNARAVARHGRFDSSLYHGERLLSYDMDSYYRYGERMRYRDHDVDWFTRVENLENDRAELLRKLDELKDQLTRSCDLAEKPSGLGTDRRMPTTPPIPYGRHHAAYVQEGLASSHGVNQQPLGPSDLKTIYSSYDHGRIPHMDNFGSTMQESYPQRNFLPEFLGYGDIHQSEIFRKPHSRPPTKFLQRPSHVHHPGHYMDINRNLFASHSHETFLHQPACSCVDCFNNNLHLPPKIHQRSQDDPNHLYHPNPVLQCPQGYISEGSNSRQMHSRQPLSMSSNGADSENGGLIYHHPKKAAVAHGSGRTCSPIAGGAPLITCYNCFKLLKLQRKHISMVKNQKKIKCGACSSIILFELGNNGIIISVLANIDQVPTETDNGSTGTLDKNFSYSHGDFGANTDDVNTCSNAYDDSEPKYSPRDKKSNSSESGKRLDPLSLSSSFSENEQRLDIVNARKDIYPSAELPFKEATPYPLPDSLPQQCPDHSSANNMVNGYEKGNKSKRSEQEKVSLDKLTSRQNSVKDAPVATEMDVSLNEFSNSCVSQDSVDTSKEDQPRITKGGESFFVGLIKKSFRDFSKSNQNVEDGRSQVFVNGHFIPDRLVKKAEKLAGPIQPGGYWYDIQAGFWGVMGHPCLGIIMPNIEEFNYPMPENCAAGNTGVFVNGRELHQRDLDLLSSRGLPITRHRSYIVEISGKVMDEHTGEELDGLGKLASTVKREKRGFEDDGKCNVFIGDWIPYQVEPIYTNESCSFIEDHQNCIKNGRPDTGYLHWRWNPHGCKLARFDPDRFLESMMNKSWALIGDSISRNHIQSLLCILSTIEKAVEVYHDEGYKSRRWIFPTYNFTISVIWSPLLAKASIFEDVNGVSTSEIELHLDILDMNWTKQLQSLDYMIISSGKWFVKNAIYYENSKILGCHNCPKRNFTELGFNFAYRKVLHNVFDYIIRSNHKGIIFFRTSTPDHFENGEWFSGGSCRRTVPAKEGDFGLSDVNKVLREVELEEFEKASAKAFENGVNLKLFDVTPLSLLRPDGHPGPYRFFQPFAKDKNAKMINDCLHWCLPGPIDSWNDLLMDMVFNN